MKTTGVSNIPKFGLLFFLGHPTVDAPKWLKDTRNGPETISPIYLSLFPGSLTYLGASRGLQSQKFCIYIDINAAHSGPYFDLSWPPAAENQ